MKARKKKKKEVVCSMYHLTAKLLEDFRRQ